MEARGTFGYLRFDMGDSTTGDNLLIESRLSSSSSSGVGSFGSTVSNEVCEDIESRTFVDPLEVALEMLLDDVLGLILTSRGDSFGCSSRFGLGVLG